MHNGYYTVKDVVELNSTQVNKYNPEIAKELLTGVTSPIDLVKKIEKYNDDNKLPYNKRIPYSVGIGEARHISVLKAYELGGTSWCFVGWDITGFPGMIYDGTKLESAMSSISSHVVEVSKIIYVQIGAYDSEKMADIFETFTKYNDLSEKQMVSTLMDLHESIFVFHNNGKYRSAIKKFSYAMKNNGINDWPLTFKNDAYNKYLMVFEKYINVVKEIINDVFNPGRITTINKDNLKVRNKIFVIDDLANIDKLIDIYHGHEKNTKTWEINYEDWKNWFMERTFTVEEIKDFLKIIDADDRPVNQDPYLN